MPPERHETEPDDPFLIGTFACLENCEFGMSWFYNHNLRAIYELVNLDVQLWNSTWNPGFMLLDQTGRNRSILSDAFVQVASFDKVGWFVQLEFAGISFWQTEFVTYFVLTERVEPK